MLRTWDALYLQARSFPLLSSPNKERLAHRLMFVSALSALATLVRLRRKWKQKRCNEACDRSFPRFSPKYPDSPWKSRDVERDVRYTDSPIPAHLLDCHARTSDASESDRSGLSTPSPTVATIPGSGGCSPGSTAPSARPNRLGRGARDNPRGFVLPFCETRVVALNSAQDRPY